MQIWSLRTFAGILQCLIVLFLSAKPSEQATNPEVEIDLGRIEGQRVYVDRDIIVDEYLGIPFAKPPVGNLRFQKPQPVVPWGGTLVARTASACVQYSDGPVPWYDNRTGTSEDCLHLNIWTPSRNSDSSLLEVMFWLFGGAFHLGSNRMKVYDGRVLSALGNVVVVVPNFRFGVMGYLHSKSNDAPGNVALYDMLQSLLWVRNHIHAFGGNKDKITIMGESSGSNSISLFAVSPMVERLYNKAIMESGAATNMMFDDPDHDFKLGEKLARSVGCSNDSSNLSNDPRAVVNCLKDLPATTLVFKTVEIMPNSTYTFLPRYGDEFVPVLPRSSILSGNFKTTDLLIGCNQNEGSAFLTIRQPQIFGFFGKKPHDMTKTEGTRVLKTIFLSNFDKNDQRTIVDHYLGDVNENDFDEVRDCVVKAIGDISIVCPAVYYAEKNAEQMPKTYFYVFDHRPSTTQWAEWMGVAHFEEVQFVFGNPITEVERYQMSEVTLSREIVKMWTKFAKTGFSDGEWPEYSKENPELLQIDLKSNKEWRGPHMKNCNFLRPYFGL